MTLKIHFIRLYMNITNNLGGVSAEQGERFYQDLKPLKQDSEHVRIM